MSDEGATPRELLIEACRRNNTDLLSTIISSPSHATSSVADFLNNTTDALGRTALHLAAEYGSYDILDMLLDQEGVEIDLREKREEDTALHKGVRYVNSVGEGERAEAIGVVEILIDAGCDPRYVAVPYLKNTMGFGWSHMHMKASAKQTWIARPVKHLESYQNYIHHRLT